MLQRESFIEIKKKKLVQKQSQSITPEEDKLYFPELGIQKMTWKIYPIAINSQNHGSLPILLTDEHTRSKIYYTKQN